MTALPDFFQFRCPTKIVYGVGMARDFHAELDALGLERLFIITDQILVKAGIVDRVVQGLTDGGKTIAGIFADVPSDSGVKVIEACAAAATASGCDAIVAIGGGSVLDTAKGANILVTLGGDLINDYSGAQTIGQALRPLVAIPTTAGTGSEVTEAIVVLDEATQTKLTFVDEHLLPTLAVLDPELTVSMPPKTTAATGMDALTHAVEAMASIQRSPMSDALALAAITLVHTHLITAVKEPANLDARGGMLIAATLAGIAFDHAKVGVVHAVAHTIGAMCHVHHGTANSIFLPYGMQYNLDEAAAAYAQMATAFELSASGSDDVRARAVIEAVVALRQSLNDICGLPQTLSAVGVSEDALPAIADGAVADGASFQNPRPVEAETLLPILQQAL